MSDVAATPTSSTKLRGWTDTEKLGILFQIIAKMDKPVPWAELDLPEGRTLKAVQVMVDKEKTKLKKALAEDGNTPATPSSTSKKRIATKDGEESKAKKPKTPRKVKSKADDEEGTTETPALANAANVKAESDDEL